MDKIPDDHPMQNPPPLAGLDPADLLRQGAAEDTLVDGASSAFVPPPLEDLAKIFPQFEILELIGQGGMGAVYKVRQKDLDRVVALKILPPGIGQSPEFSNRFTREARALAKLNHPGIVTLHEFGQQDGLYFILMEFVDGVNLAQLMNTGRVSPREALAIVPQICDALQYAHDQGIVHRDIKPENLLLDRTGRVKVADFGIAKAVASVCDPIRSGDTPVPADATLAGKIIGTPQYMAPEQIEHPSDVDHRADIYALGVVFYQMLTGELPGKELQAPSRKVSIDVRLDEMVLRALEEKPERRYQTALEFRTMLDGLPPATPPPIPKRGMMRRWWWVFLVMIPLGTLLGFLVAGVVTYVVPKKYEAKATVKVVPVNGSAITPTFFGNQFEVIKSRAALTAVSQELELPNKWMTDGETAVSILKRNISTHNIGGTDRITIKVRHTNREDAAEITSAVIRNYQRSFGGKIIILETPQPPRMPVSPNVTLNLVIGSAGGLLASPLMALVLILLLHAVFPETKSINSPPQASRQASVIKTRVETVAAVGKTSESASSPLRDKALKWFIHLIWAACTSGLVALAIMFVAEVLTSDRGNLNRSRMTHEDFYGPVITVLLGIGLLSIPIKAFRFASARVWIGAVFATAGITAITYVLAAPVEDRGFHADNFIIAVALCAFGAFLCGFAAVFGKEKPQASQDIENQTPPARWRKTKWIAAACLAIGVLWFALRPPGRSYPGSSTSSAFKAPVMGHIKFRYRHPDATGGGAISYPVKGWGDTQWKPSLGQTISLKGGRELSFKTRVDAMRSNSPVAMVTTSSDNSNWETKALKIDGDDALRQLAFSNGLRVEIHWSPADSSRQKGYPIDPIQQQVMLSASRESDRMHPLKVDEATLIGPPALRFVGLQYPSQERWHPDGSLVTDPHELALMREIGPIYAGDMSKGETIRGMEFCFSHPLLESWHITEIEFLDESGMNTARLGGINGTQKETFGAEGRLHWSLRATPVDISKPLNVRLSYTLGPLERVQEHIVEPNASGSLFSDGNTRVASVGQTAGGDAFVALSVDDATQSKHRFGVEAVTKDGAIIQHGSWQGGGRPGSPEIITFEFRVPISEVAKFRIGTRPLRSVVWKNVAVSAKDAVPDDNETNAIKNSANRPEKKLAAYDWKSLAAEGRTGDRVPQTLDGRTVLKIENLTDEPLQAQLLTIEKPPISATKYAVSGEVRYENVQGQAYLEMWSDFPEGRYFSRTLGDPGSGPMSQLTGMSAWRKFILPFDRTGTKGAPTRIEVNLFLPGHGVVFVGSLKLIEVSPDEMSLDEKSYLKTQKALPDVMNEQSSEVEKISFRELPAANRLQIRMIAPDDPLAVPAELRLDNGTKSLLKLSNNVVICDKHVKDAGIQKSSDEYEIAISLNDVGTKRLAAATKDADGKMRLAVIVDGEVMSAPMVMNQLGRQFVFAGFRDQEKCFGLVRDLMEWPDENSWSGMSAWLEMIDQGKSVEAWNMASGYLRQNISREQFEQMAAAARKPLGDRVARTLSSAKRMESPPGAPDGLYLVSEFDSSFTDKKNATEVITLLKEKDGRWRICGYFIR